MVRFPHWGAYIYLNVVFLSGYEANKVVDSKEMQTGETQNLGNNVFYSLIIA